VILGHKFGAHNKKAGKIIYLTIMSKSIFMQITTAYRYSPAEHLALRALIIKREQPEEAENSALLPDKKDIIKQPRLLSVFHLFSSANYPFVPEQNEGGSESALAQYYQFSKMFAHFTQKWQAQAIQFNWMTICILCDEYQGAAAVIIICLWIHLFSQSGVASAATCAGCEYSFFTVSGCAKLLDYIHI